MSSRRAILWLVAVWIALGSFSIWYSGKQIRDSQIAACRDSLAPGGLRWVIASNRRDEIKVHKGNIRRTRHIDYAKYGLTVSVKVRRNAIQREFAAIAHQREKIRNVLGIDCEAQYPQPWPLSLRPPSPWQI